MWGSGTMEPEGNSKSQDGVQYPRTWGLDQHPGLSSGRLSSGREPWGMVMYLGMGGWAKGPGHPEGALQPPKAHLASLRPPGFDHTGCLSPPPPSPDLRPAQGLRSAVLMAGQTRPCVCVCVYMHVPL